MHKQFRPGTPGYSSKESTQLTATSPPSATAYPVHAPTRYVYVDKPVPVPTPVAVARPVEVVSYERVYRDKPVYQEDMDPPLSSPLSASVNKSEKIVYVDRPVPVPIPVPVDVPTPIAVKRIQYVDRPVFVDGPRPAAMPAPTPLERLEPIPFSVASMAPIEFQPITRLAGSSSVAPTVVDSQSSTRSSTRHSRRRI